MTTSKLNKIFFYVDVNNAFLSWTAVELLKSGYKTDIRTIPSIIAGDEELRHGTDWPPLTEPHCFLLAVRLRAAALEAAA